MSDKPWWEKCDYVSNVGCWPFGLIGEDEYGDWLLPTCSLRKALRPGGWWDRRLDLRRPWHWPSYLHTRLTRKLVYIDG